MIVAVRYQLNARYLLFTESRHCDRQQWKGLTMAAPHSAPNYPRWKYSCSVHSFPAKNDTTFSGHGNPIRVVSFYVLFNWGSIFSVKLVSLLSLDKMDNNTFHETPYCGQKC